MTKTKSYLSRLTNARSPNGAEYRDVGDQSCHVVDIRIRRVITKYRAQILGDSNGNQYTAPFLAGVITKAWYGTSVKTKAVHLSQFRLIPYAQIPDYFANQLLITLAPER